MLERYLKQNRYNENERDTHRRTANYLTGQPAKWVPHQLALEAAKMKPVLGLGKPL